MSSKVNQLELEGQWKIEWGTIIKLTKKNLETFSFFEVIEKLALSPKMNNSFVDLLIRNVLP